MDIEAVLISAMFQTELIGFCEAGNMTPDVWCDHKELLKMYGEPLEIPALNLVLGDYVGQDKRFEVVE
jgi:hypothetical protein